MQSNNQSANKESQSINVLDLLAYLLTKWKWFLLSILICGGAAWYYYARTPKTYFSSATVIIKDPSNKTSSAAGLDRYDNVINKVNVANEILQFRSKAIMRETVKRLKADVSYKVKDNLTYKELYTKSPIRVSFPDATEEMAYSVHIKMANEKTASVFWEGPVENNQFKVNIGDTLKTPYGRLLISKSDYFNNEWIGTNIIVRKSPLSASTAYFRSVMGIRQENEESSILNLSLKDGSPERAVDILNTLIDVYNEEAINDKNKVAVNTAEFINDRIAIIEEELGGVESDLESFKRENQILDISSAAGRYMGESQKYSAEAVELETQLRMAQYIRDYLTDPTKEGELLPANTGINDMNIESQISQYNTMRLRRDKLIVDSSDKNPVVQELTNSMQSMKQSIIRAVDNVIANINVRRRDAKTSEMRAQARVSTIPTKERQMLSIERQHNIKESLYLFLLNRREENAISQAMVDNNARVIDGAEGSSAPIAPNRNRIILLGILVGIAIPGVIFLLILFLDTRIHSRKDIQDAISVPFLGEIPIDKNQKKKSNKKSKKTNAIEGMWDETSNSVKEAMRILRTNMTFMGKRGKKLQVITFTSFNEGAGKTFIAKSLAKSLVNAKKSVIVVDLDIRKGTLSRPFPKHVAGVTNYLADETVRLEDIIHLGEAGKTPDVIACGPIAPNPAELLMDERLDKLVNELRERYDYVVIDNVPVGIIADASIANRITDLTIFVMRAERFDRRSLPEVENLYKENKLKNMAVALNGIDPNSWGYGYGRYGYGYGYGYGHYGYGYGYGYGESKNKE